jgi:radical SAM superfamily enzyme YgiQ (UPF0313 family)
MGRQILVIDHDGASLAQGGESTNLTPAGVAVVAAVAAGAQPDLEALAARHHEPVEPLADVLALASDVISPQPAGDLLAPRLGEFGPEDAPAPLGAEDVAAVVVQSAIPLPVICTADGFVAWPSRQAEPVVLDADAVVLLAWFALPRRTEKADADALPGNRLLADPSVRDGFVAEHLRTGLLQSSASFQPRVASARGESTLSSVNERTKTLVRRQADLLAARPPRNGRTAVFPVNRSPRTGPPLALGLLFSHAMAYDGGRLEERYDFVPNWTIRPKALPKLLADGPAVFLCSDYVWSINDNHEVARRVKELSPESLVVHGGPNAPKYPEDRDRFFAEHPEIDVVVHGEGEAAVAELLDALGPDLTDLTVLADVAGLSYRAADGSIVTTADRDRIVDLDAIPSPYLTGLFDAFKDGATELMIIESNRGCPYGCTFCDWGSATLSRIRKFSMERVQAEIAWAGEAGAKVVVMGDSNYGIFERDVELAETFVATKARYGAPEQVVFSYAKNTVKHVEKIVRTMVDGGIFGQAGISIQSFDEQTLDIINRKNIKTERYDDLTRTFRDSKLPVYTDLMVGLPGSTVQSVRDDLQRCIERDVMVRSYPTQLLTNSPMNAPEYRALHQIRADENDLLISTSTYTEADRREMDRIVDRFHAAESYGTLRQVGRWVTHRTGVDEIEVLAAIGDHADADPGRFPLTSWVLARFLHYSVPPAAWAPFYDEVGQIIGEQWGAELIDEEWATVRRVQEALMPDRGRRFPISVDLDHDYVAWSWAFSEARADGTDPCVVVPRLATYGPGHIDITDPNRVCEEQMGAWHWSADYHYWELGSPLARHLGGRWAPSH